MSYEELLQYVLENGVDSEDRTGTGTFSSFGPQIRYNLALGFPLITTKKVHFKSIVHELLWVIAGNTNTKYMSENNVTIWDEWSDSNGNLGPIYGHQMRNFGGKYQSIKQPKPDYSQYLQPVKLTVYGVGFLGMKKTEITDEMRFFLRKWRNMLKRCYSKKFEHYSYYGGKGVHVSNEWLCFRNFYSDAKLVEGLDVSNLSNLELDKDINGDGFRYSKDTCKWVTADDNKRAILHHEYTVEDKAGNKYTFRNAADFRKTHNINNQGNFNSMLRGERDWSNGFKLISRVDLNKGVDQLSNVIEGLKEDPYSRRHVITLWNPSDLDKQALHCCHGTVIQFYVRNNKLSCSMYQRSADLFLGVPFNIASYALFTQMVAQICGYELGELVITFGDAHIYKNHLPQVNEQLSRGVLAFPKVELNKDVKDIMSFKYEDVKLCGYQSHKAIKGDVAV
jgi:thymidylate synthase